MTKFKLIKYIISCEEKQEKSDAASAASLLWFVWRLAFAEKFTHSTANDERPTANELFFHFFHGQADAAAGGIDADDFGFYDVAGVDDVCRVAEGVTAQLGAVHQARCL